MSTVAPSTTSAARLSKKSRLPLALAIVVVLLTGAAGAWLGSAGYIRLPGANVPTDKEATAHAGEHDHAAHGGHDHQHGHPGHDEATSIELSAEAQRNIGLEVAPVDFQEFERTVSLPAIIVERPGQSQIDVAAPLTGVVTRIYPILGQAVRPGDPLFELRLTHEELVQAQGDFLRALQELDVVNREIARLDKIVAGGAVAGKVVLERQYEKEKLEAILLAQEQALVLHGLSKEQVESIRRDRQLLGTLTVVAPASAHTSPGGASDACLLQLQDLRVELGQHVTAGDPLCELADHCELFIEGKAFEQDAKLLNEATRKGWEVRAALETGEGQTETIPGLKILLVGNRVDPESRTFTVQAEVNNELVRNEQMPDGRRVIGWKLKPGQRVQLEVPVETWKERIVLPVEAVVQEGPESYVFVQNGDHFDRRPVHVEYRDGRGVVLSDSNDKIWPGDKVAISGAAQLQLGLKSKAGGGIDPHAGHNH
ncbi:MAG: efflux RND transporter periplasmic adaptor subunit [Pirellulales bacterium]|nr:efflux RND transporter periplasmic adaptor subunit [Pirellulales bacterium]